MGKLSKIKFVVSSLIIALIAGCSSNFRDMQMQCYAEDPEYNSICDKIRGYSYKEPIWIRDINWRERGVSISTYDFPLTRKEKKQLRNVTYDGSIPSPSSCTPNSIGITYPEEIIVENACESVWGRMDYRELWRFSDSPAGFTNICGPQSGEAIYAFCSEQDDKRVVICISQETNDKELAHNIFKTFKWLDTNYDTANCPEKLPDEPPSYG